MADRWSRVWEFTHRFKADKRLVLLLLIPNLVGITFGYYYYWDVGQFNPASQHFRAYGWWPFIPDSPNAVLLLVACQFLYLAGRRSRVLDSIAFVSMLYVGLWTTMLFLTYADELGTFEWGGTNNILFFSHLGMPLEALILVRDLRRDAIPWLLAGGVAAWNLLNLWLDYGPLDLHPAPFLADHAPMHAASPWIMAFAMLAWLWSVQWGLGRKLHGVPSDALHPR